MFSVPQTPISHSGPSGCAVRVYARTRPLLENESSRGAKSILKILKEEKQMSVEDTNEKLFKFENVFDERTPQEDVYKIAVAPLVSKVAEGHNAAVLAYGQTGSGKTFTMGTDPSVAKEDEGILQRVMFELLGTKGIDENRPLETGQGCLTISFLEVYNEVIYDLLTLTRNPLKTKTGFGGAVSPVGMVEEQVTCVEEGLKLLERGSHNRSVASTALNQHSSRSHALIYITVQNHGVSGCLILVDLAGAEGVGRAQTSGQQFTEGIHINKGLLTLGKVLSALSNPAPVYVPYRESVLTRLLKDSLGGASHTAMIACVNPASYNLHETLNTLRYAEQAQNIKTKPQVFSTIKRTGVKRRCEDVTATPGAWKRRTMMSDVKKSHNTTVSTPGHKPPKKVESKFNNTFTTPSFRLNEVGINSNFLAPSIGVPLRQPIFEDDSPSQLSTVSTLENPEPHPNLSPYLERISNKLEQSIMNHFESIEDRVADRIISKLKSTKKSKSSRKSTRRLSGGNSNSGDSSDDSMSSVAKALFGGKAGKKFFQLLGNVLKDTQSQVAEGINSEKENKVDGKTLNPRHPLCDVSNLIKSDTKTAENINRPHMNEELATCNILSDQPITSTAFNSKRYVRRSTRMSTQKSMHNAIYEKVSPLCPRQDYSPLLSFSKLDETACKDNTIVVMNHYGTSPELCPKLSSESMKASGLEETMLYNEVLNLPGNSALPLKDAKFVLSPSAISVSPLQIDRISKRKAPVRRSMRMSALKATQRNFEILTGNSPTTSLCKQKVEKRAQPNATVQVAGDASPNLNTTTMTKWKLVMSPRLQEDYYKEILEVLNTGTVRKLQSLPTIGPKTALVLYNYRQMFGKFDAVEDMAKIPALPKSFYGRFMKANLMNRLSFDI